MNKTQARILGYVARGCGCVNVYMCAADLRLAVDRVTREVGVLIERGLVEHGWDGVALATTDSYRREALVDERVRSFVRAMRAPRTGVTL